jgi:hypothetical protein
LLKGYPETRARITKVKEEERGRRRGEGREKGRRREERRDREGEKEKERREKREGKGDGAKTNLHFFFNFFNHPSFFRCRQHVTASRQF